MTKELIKSEDLFINLLFDISLNDNAQSIWHLCGGKCDELYAKKTVYFSKQKSSLSAHSQHSCVCFDFSTQLPSETSIFAQFLSYFYIKHFTNNPHKMFTWKKYSFSPSHDTTNRFFLLHFLQHSFSSSISFLISLCVYQLWYMDRKKAEKKKMYICWLASK